MRHWLPFVLVAGLSVSCTQITREFDPMDFHSPSSSYRPAPFWSWNDVLVEEELRWQVRQLKAAGYGGFFMHPRVGLETEYLSDEWFEKIGACVDEARRTDMLAWLYDEDKWPSGFAGGWLNRRFPETRGVALVGEGLKPEAVGEALSAPETLAVFAVGKDDKRAIGSSRRLKSGDLPNAGEAVIRFRTQPFVNENWYNGEAYLDILNPDAVGKFLDLTMEGYNRRFRADRETTGGSARRPSPTRATGPIATCSPRMG